MVRFTGWIVREGETGPRAELGSLPGDLLGDFDTTVRVWYSGINYKDALALQGRPGVIRTHPLVPGIDLVGEVVSSTHPRWRPGDVVVLNGAGFGEEYHGGLAELARVSGDDLVAVPAGFTPKQAAAVGTAGFTAALSLLALQRAGLTPGRGPVLVTGAGGGVGSIALALLAGAGYQAHAVTGRPELLHEQLTGLGATEIWSRADLVVRNAEGEVRPLAKQRWAGVIDSVGGTILAAALASLRQEGVATTCGLAGGAAFPGNVLPFILRGISLLGIDSVRTPPGRRAAAWRLIGQALRPGSLAAVTSTVALADVQPVAERLLAGHGTGRTVVVVAGAGVPRDVPAPNPLWPHPVDDTRGINRRWHLPDQPAS